MKTYNITTRDFMESIFVNLQPEVSDSSSVILYNGKTIYKSEDTKNYNFLDFFKDHCKGSFLEKYNKPYMVWTGVGSIVQLEKLTYDKNTIDYLNREGLTIFFHEMLLFGFGEKKKLLPKKEWIKNNKEITYEHADFNFSFEKIKSNNIYNFELDSVVEFVRNNNLRNVTVYTCESGTKEILQNLYPEIEIKSHNVWTASYNITHLDKKTDVNQKNYDLKRHFFSLSLRYEIHKHLISAYLLDKDAEISWHENSREWHSVDDSFEYLNSQTPFDIENWKKTNPRMHNLLKENVKYLKDHFPMLLECENLPSDKNNRIRCGTEHKLPYKSYTESFCNVICETKFAQPFGYFSEKVIHAMYFKRPFILVSTPRSLEYLKSYGFKTFDKWWDESYDDNEDHEKRILKIFEIIDEIENWSIKDCETKLNEMEDVLAHNQINIGRARKIIGINE